MNYFGLCGAGPPAKRLPIAEVREVDANKTPPAQRPTPNRAAIQLEADRMYGQRAYDTINAINLWMGFGEPEP